MLPRTGQVPVAGHKRECVVCGGRLGSANRQESEWRTSCWGRTGWTHSCQAHRLCGLFGTPPRRQRVFFQGYLRTVPAAFGPLGRRLWRQLVECSLLSCRSIFHVPCSFPFLRAILSFLEVVDFMILRQARSVIFPFVRSATYRHEGCLGAFKGAQVNRQSLLLRYAEETFRLIGSGTG